MTPKLQRLVHGRRLGAVLLTTLLMAAVLPSAVLAAVPAAPSVPDLAPSSDTGSSNTDNITKTLNSLVFTGTAEAGSTVNIYANGTPPAIGQAVATAGGNYTVTTTIAIPDNSPNLITATATNGSGEGPASAALIVTTDNTVPGAPTTPDLQATSDTGVSSIDNLTSDTTPTFDGTAEAGASVLLYAGATNVGSATANGATGAWTITSSTLGDGTYSFTAVQFDVAGNGPSVASSGLSVTINTTVPAPPSAPDLQAGSDTGSSSTDNITNDVTPTFGGNGAPADTRVDLYAGANVVGTTTSDGTGAWTVTTTNPMTAGTYLFTAKAVGTYGSSAASAGLSVTIYTALTVTINQATGQKDPTGTSPVNYTVVFSQSVSDFVTGDVVFTGSTAGGSKVGTVTGNGTTYNVAVTGMTSAGSLIALINAGVATDAAGNANQASTSSDNAVAWAPGGPTVTINQAVGQADPTVNSPINFTVVFSASVSDFATGDVALSGTAGATTATVTGTGTTYNVAVSGMTASGTVIATIPEGVASASSLPNLASTSTDNSVTWQPGPSVTINQAADQTDPTGVSPINFTVVFSAPVTGFTTGDVTIGGTAGGTKVGTVTGSGAAYTVAVTGMTTAGTVTATIPAGAAVDSFSRLTLASTSSDNTVTWSPGGPTVTINQASGQADPTATSPINFTVVFSAAVNGFATGDVAITGTAGGTKTATVTGSGTTYNVAVTGMTTAGTVIATVPGGVALTASLLPNLVSTSTDNTVTWNSVPTPITLTTSASVITWGSGIILTTQFGANGANRTFTLQAARDGVTWVAIASLRTDLAGRATFTYRPATNNFYRAVFAGAADLVAGNSNTVRTVVREIGLLRPTNLGAIKTIARNTSITFSLTVRPSRPELTPATAHFVFYRLVRSTWTLVGSRTVTVDSTGIARTTFKFTSSGKWYVRAQANPTPYNANSVWSPLERYNVG
jgi:hypothetical protein